MFYIIPLAILALISFGISFAVSGSNFGRRSNLLVLMMVSGFWSALPWFGLWLTAHLNQQHCPARGPCRLDGMQMIGEVVFLYAFPPAFVFGLLSALVIAIGKRNKLRG